jgi:hypothetical protein
MAFSQDRARSLSVRQRQFLLRHIDGPVPVETFNAKTIHPLVAKGLIKCVPPVNPSNTELTRDGRFALGVILGDAADLLSSAGIIDKEAARRVALFIECRNGRDGTTPAPSQYI